VNVTKTSTQAMPSGSVDDDQRIIFGAPDIGEAEIEEVVATLRSGWIGTGPKTKHFETLFAEYVAKEHAVATNSGTAALHLALTAMGVGPGDEVITTPLTFVATANVIEHCGATPVFADVHPSDGTLEPVAVAENVTPRTKAIMPVHYAGVPARVAELRRRHPDIPIVVDAAHAVETRHSDGSTSAGAGATCTAYSFYVTKNLVTGEGGMLVTDSDELAHSARVRSLHGLDHDAWSRYSSGAYGSYELECPGFKYNMTDIQASLGIHQLMSIEKRHERRREIWARYNRSFQGLEHRGIYVPPASLDADLHGRHARHLYTLWVNWRELGCSRREFVQRLSALGVGTGWHFRAVHLQKYYAEKYGYADGAFPVAETIADRTISIPLSSALSDAEVGRVIDAVLEVATESRSAASADVTEVVGLDRRRSPDRVSADT
jgi:dTDP-4-amino-4,6-dideoxygalactose transaminase